ncbi:MAG: hypothetical protein QOG98_1440 [Pseudonocardiales bacterium]|nr:hypothetical protein [Pseudonocardiales bacterium]
MSRKSNDPVSVETRLQFVLAVLAHELTVAEAARRHGVSTESINRWRNRFIDAGKAGGDLDDCTHRNTRLDQLCTDIGRNPATITRSIVLPFTAHRPNATRDAIQAVRDAGFTRIMLGLGSPYPEASSKEL